MLQIVLTVLKIAGIFLLVLLGFLLLAIVAALCVSVVYRGKGSYDGKPSGFLKITWLLHMISFKISYDQQGGKILIRFFGVPLTSSKKKKRRKKKKASPVLQEEEEPILYPEEDEPLVIQELEAPEPVLDEAAEQVEEKPKKKLRRKKKRLGLIQRITATWKRLKHSVRNFFRSYQQMREKTDTLWKELHKEENIKTMKLIGRQLKRLIRHVCPRKLKGRISFGFDDPYRTGKILTYAGLLYPYYHGKMEIIPVFDRQIIEGNLEFKGRIRLGTILFCMLRVYMDKNFRNLYKRWMEQ